MQCKFQQDAAVNYEVIVYLLNLVVRMAGELGVISICPSITFSPLRPLFSTSMQYVLLEHLYVIRCSYSALDTCLF